MICSTALRARETWELASAGLRTAAPGADPAVRYESRVYEATVLGLLMLVREFPPEWRTALLVGHNPGMAELTVGLADPSSDPPSAFPTAAVAVLARARSVGRHRPGRGRPGGFRDPGRHALRVRLTAVQPFNRSLRRNGSWGSCGATRIRAVDDNGARRGGR